MGASETQFNVRAVEKRTSREREREREREERVESQIVESQIESSEDERQVVTLEKRGDKWCHVVTHGATWHCIVWHVPGMGTMPKRSRENPKDGSRTHAPISTCR